MGSRTSSMLEFERLELLLKRGSVKTLRGKKVKPKDTSSI
jgi:hypothetical protein